MDEVLDRFDFVRVKTAMDAVVATCTRMRSPLGGVDATKEHHPRTCVCISYDAIGRWFNRQSELTKRREDLPRFGQVTSSLTHRRAWTSTRVPSGFKSQLLGILAFRRDLGTRFSETANHPRLARIYKRLVYSCVVQRSQNRSRRPLRDCRRAARLFHVQAGRRRRIPARQSGASRQIRKLGAR